jgi:arylsulfatase A-like enzyme
MPETRNRSHRHAGLLLALGILVLGFVAWNRREPPPRPRPRNVIFILVDTLRADRLSTYGYERSTSPNLDAFARESVRFLNARSQAPCTFPSVNSLLTSRWPSAFLGQPDQAVGIPEGIPSLAEILHARGFHTVAVSASAVVRRSPSRYNPLGGFGRGFDVFDEECVWKSAGCVNRRALPHLRKGDRPLFAYLHYLDPHGPYQPPEHYRRRFALGRPDKLWVRIGDVNPIADWLYRGKENPGFTAQDLRHLSDLYDDEIAFFDESFDDLLAALRASGLLDESVVIFAADHGEEFLEHGHVKHCRTLFDTSLRVPLLIHVPGMDARTVSAPVQNLDLVPTLLDLLGLAPSSAPFDGRTLRPLLEGKRAPSPLQHALMGTLRSASDGRYKLIADLATHTYALYDLAADPSETKNVLTLRRHESARLRQSLIAWLAASEGPEGLRRSREAEERLRALGYIQ